MKFEEIALDQTFKSTFKSYDRTQDMYTVELVSNKGENVNQKFGGGSKPSFSGGASSGFGGGGSGGRSVSLYGGGDLDMKIEVDHLGSSRSRRGSDGRIVYLYDDADSIDMKIKVNRVGMLRNLLAKIQHFVLFLAGFQNL